MFDKFKDNLEYAEHEKYIGSTVRSHWVFFFENGYGASIISCIGSDGRARTYGNKSNPYELAVIIPDGSSYDLCYDTPITGDVLKHLTEAEVEAVLDLIRALPVRNHK